MNLSEYKFPIGKKIFNPKKNNNMYVYAIRSTYLYDGDSKNDSLYGIFNSLEKAYINFPSGYDGWVYIEVWDIEKGIMIDKLQFEDIRKTLKYLKQ